MSDVAFDLDAYLKRIGADGSGAPSLAALRAIVLAHATTLPFETIDGVLGRPPKLDLASLQHKMIARRRGGYCHEHGFLLRAALRALGFSVTSRLGRVVLGMPLDAPQPVGHQSLVVALPEGVFHVDVAFGNRTPTAPLAWLPDVEQPTPHEPMRLRFIGEEMVVEAQHGDEWQHFYRMLPGDASDIDCEVSNWFTGAHPACPLVTNLVVARPGLGGTRTTFFNGRLTIRPPSGEPERHIVDDAASYRAVLAEHLGVELDMADAEALLAALDRAGTRGGSHPFFT